jgi:hypothetical protein
MCLPAFLKKRKKKNQSSLQAESKERDLQKTMTIEGTVSFQDLEGGFWGIVDLDGNRYVPMESLPDDVMKDGLKIKAEVETVQVIGTTQWGSYVKVHSITPAS